MEIKVKLISASEYEAFLKEKAENPHKFTKHEDCADKALKIIAKGRQTYIHTELLKKLDLNNDGTISEAEFCHSAKTERMHNIFMAMDNDKDGHISGQEIHDLELGPQNINFD